MTQDLKNNLFSNKVDIINNIDQINEVVIEWLDDVYDDQEFLDAMRRLKKYRKLRFEEQIRITKQLSEEDEQDVHRLFCLIHHTRRAVHFMMNDQVKELYDFIREHLEVDNTTPWVEQLMLQTEERIDKIEEYLNSTTE